MARPIDNVVVSPISWTSSAGAPHEGKGDAPPAEAAYLGPLKRDRVLKVDFLPHCLSAQTSMGRKKDALGGLTTSMNSRKESAITGGRKNSM